MRAYCQDKQYAGVKKLAGREATSATMRTIRDKCERDWPDDFAMRDYCEEKQIAAVRELSR